MSHRLARVVSDLSHSNSHSVTMTDHSLHRQSATSNNEGRNAGNKSKKKLSLLISSVVSCTRSESSCETETGSRERNSSRKQQTDGGAGERGRGLETIVLAAVRKYVAMVEQLFTSSYSAAGSSRRDVDGLHGRRRPHTFTSARHAGGNGNAAAAAHSSKRHGGRLRLPSAPASMRGSPAASGHLSVGESVTTSSEVSTMEELQSAIQAAIAHCNNSGAADGGDRQQQQQQRKC